MSTVCVHCMLRVEPITDFIFSQLESTAVSQFTSPSVCFPPVSSRSEQVCLVSSDFLHMHLALAGMRFYYCYFYFYRYSYHIIVTIIINAHQHAQESISDALQRLVRSPPQLHRAVPGGCKESVRLAELQAGHSVIMSLPFAQLPAIVHRVSVHLHQAEQKF